MIHISMLKNKSSLLEGSLYSLFSFLNQGASFLLLILLANYIQPAEYGMLSMFNTLVQLVTFFIAFSSSGYISVSYFSKEFQEFRSDFSSIMILGGISVIMIIGIIWIFKTTISNTLDLPIGFVWFSLVICVAQFLHNVNLDVIRIQEKVYRYGVFSCGCAALNFILSLILVIGFNLSWRGRVYAQLFVMMVFGIIAIYLFCKNRFLTSCVNSNRLRSIALWGLPLIPHLAANWIKQGCDRLIINSNFTMEEVGIFSFALNLTSIITMVGFGFNQVNSVDIYKVLGNKEGDHASKLQILERQRRNLCKIYLIVYVVIITCCILGVPILLPQYSRSILYFVPLSIYGLGVCAYLLYCNYLFYYGENKKIMWITFSSSIIHLALSLLLTRYSLIFTSIIYIVMQLYIVMIIRHQSKKILQQHLV